MGPKWPKITETILFQSDPRLLGVPVDVFLARFEAYFGRFDSLHVSEGPD